MMHSKNKKEHIILLDSRLRDTSRYITPAQYIFELETPLQNVINIELIHAIYSKNDTNPEKYTYLCIKELPSKRFLPTTQGHSFTDEHVFTYLPFHKQHQDINEYEFTQSTFNASYTCESPLPLLSSLTISLIDKDGKLFPIQEHILCFRVETLNFGDDDFQTVYAEGVNVHDPQHINIINKNGNGNKPLATTKTPYEILGFVQGTFSIDMLVERFKQRANILRMSGNYSQQEYEELKQAFKTLASSIKKM